MTRILCWLDSPEVHTGFGVVSKHILKALHQTGKFDIDVLGINFFGRFYDREEYPYQITPAKLLDPSDPFGRRMLIRSLLQKQYDVLFIINDTYVTHGIAEEIAKYKAKYNPYLKIIYYFPVDCRLDINSAAMIKLADKPVTYTHFAEQEVLKVLPSLETKLGVIYHGTDIESYHPLHVEERDYARSKYFNIKDDETFIFINVNRNSVRKNLSQTILAFAEFRRIYKKKSLLYLHTVPNDQGIDLLMALNHLGLNTQTDVIFPSNYSSVDSFPDKDLNVLYNAADCFMTTSLGEGFGLSLFEAAAAGLPVLAPRNTVFPELLANDLRGLLYPVTDQVYIDSSGYRLRGHTADIVNSMLQATSLPVKIKQDMINNMNQFITKYSWKNVCEDWVKLFDDTINKSSITIESV